MKILLVDDHPLYVQGVKSFLEAKGFVVAGTARSGAEALLQFEMLQPDLVLMDLQMRDGDGLEATRGIKQEFPAARIVILTACEDEDSLFAAIDAGADGYLVKGMDPEQILRQLQGMIQGEGAPIAPALAGRVMQAFTRRQGANPEETADTEPELTGRQREIVSLLLQGLTYKEIAQRTHVKETTIKYHVYELLKKFKMTTRTQLLAHMLQTGMVVEEDE